MGEVPDQYYIDDPEMMMIAIVGILVSWIALAYVLYLHGESEEERKIKARIDSDRRRGAKKRGPE